MIILATIFSGLSLLMSVLLIVRTTIPIGWFVLAPKLTAGALSPIWAIMGTVGAVIGWVYQAFWAVPLGILGAAPMIWYVWRCTRDHKGLEKAFGADWPDQISPQQAKKMVKRRWSLYLKMKAFTEPIWERNIPFWTTPDTQQELLCDIWRPGNGNVAGLAFIYFHGGGWAAFDKDFGTRPFFRHLATQGYTVMDVAYRRIPEVDIYGMIGDVKRAIAWTKANASRYGVNPEKIVLGGASAGGHLALLAGYTPGHPELTPDDIVSADLSVCGVVSFYGPTDLLASYKQYNLPTDLPSMTIGTRTTPKEGFRYSGRLDILLGGHPTEVPEMYKLASPATYVHSGTPPTLLMQGNADFVVPMVGTQELYTKLVEAGVPAVNIIFPWTDHAFDLLFPQINPAAQSALYDVDRFLALLLNKD